MTENMWENDVEERRIVATIIVNDAKAIEEDIGPIEYLENMFSDIQEMGEFDVYLENAKVIDDDDPYDTKAIKMVDKIFDYDYNETYDDVVYGDVNEVYEKIVRQYQNGGVSIGDYIASCKTPDLTIEEVVKLYANLYAEFEYDSVVRFNAEDNFAIYLDNDEMITMDEFNQVD